VFPHWVRPKIHLVHNPAFCSGQLHVMEKWILHEGYVVESSLPWHLLPVSGSWHFYHGGKSSVTTDTIPLAWKLSVDT